VDAAGILPDWQLREVIGRGAIRAGLPIADVQVQPASLDLRLGPLAYRVRASFLPSGRASVRHKLDELKTHEVDLTQPGVLERGCVYVAPLLEELALPADLAGKANPKSTIGRLDIFTRLICDDGGEFDRVPPGYHGALYAEIVPRTFSILARQGSRLNQLRLVRGTLPPPAEVQVADLRRAGEGAGPAAEAQAAGGQWISVDLQGLHGSRVIGYRARRYAPLVDLERVEAYDPTDFWDAIEPPRRGQLILDPDEFYILASRERIRVPRELAAEMVGYDPSVGEFRIHYAGFFDPGFGYG